MRKVIRNLVLLVILLGLGVWFLSKPESVPQIDLPAPTPDPRALNDYQISSFSREQDLVTYEDENYTSILGIDVSAHQKEIDWDAVQQSGIQFAMIRCGYRGYSTGELHTDDYFDTNIQNASRVGLSVGVYFYSQAITEEEAKEEAGYVLQLVKDYSFSLPIVYDMEINSEKDRVVNLSSQEITDIARAFCQVIQEAGYQPMIYGNASWLQSVLDMGQLQQYPYWLAQYQELPDFPFAYKVWQYTNKGTIDGVSTNVDLNVWITPR